MKTRKFNKKNKKYQKPKTYRNKNLKVTKNKKKFRKKIIRKTYKKG